MRLSYGMCVWSCHWPVVVRGRRGCRPASAPCWRNHKLSACVVSGVSGPMLHQTGTCPCVRPTRTGTRFHQYEGQARFSRRWKASVTNCARGGPCLVSRQLLDGVLWVASPNVPWWNQLEPEESPWPQDTSLGQLLGMVAPTANGVRASVTGKPVQRRFKIYR